MGKFLATKPVARGHRNRCQGAYRAAHNWQLVGKPRRKGILAAAFAELGRTTGGCYMNSSARL